MPNWKQMLLAALVPASAELVWVLYNTYVPLWLQADQTALTGGLTGFGLNAAVAGMILTIGNLIGLVINPVVGVLSDSTRSRLGRRKPWYLFPMPVILLTLSLIPLLGQSVGLPLFLLNLAVFLLALSVMRGPATVLLYDITPSKYRGIAAALSGIAGGTAGIVGALAAAALFGIQPGLPFWVAAAVAGAAILAAAAFVQEPILKEGTGAASQISPRQMLAALKNLPRPYLSSTILLVLNTFFTYIAFGQMQAFTSSYGVWVLGLSVGNSSLVYAMGGAAFILFSFPASAIATRWLKRKSTQALGILLYLPLALLVYFFATPVLIWPLMALLGAAWAMVMVTQEPMMLDSAPSDAFLGTYSAILQVARTLGFVVSPVLGGWVIQMAGSNYNMIWLVMAGAQLLALLALIPVQSGEAKQE